jgi:ABC-2 type transport system permease protein
MRTWWRGTTLVAQRGLVENVRSRSFKALTGLLLLLSIAAVTIPQILGAHGTTYTLATIGKAPAAVVATLDAAGKPAGFTVTYVSRLDEAAVRKAVRDGDATAGWQAGPCTPLLRRQEPSQAWSPRLWSHLRPRGSFPRLG